MIYLSTGGFTKKSFLQVADLFGGGPVKGLELSSGLYTPTLESDLKCVASRFEVALHNYFPVPKEPFVFNLASLDEEIVQKSLAHAKHAIRLTAMLGGEFYSFHAGYLLDPQVSELGRRIGAKRLNDRVVGLRQFIANVNSLADYAAQYEVTLLIENNVLSASNFKTFGCDPLLMTEPEETWQIFEAVDDGVKLLIDVAHLKVSANTLGFNPVDYLSDFRTITGAYHISDNNGLEDSNEPFSRDAWFIPYIKKGLPYYSLEIYVSDIAMLESQYQLFSDVLR